MIKTFGALESQPISIKVYTIGWSTYYQELCIAPFLFNTYLTSPTLKLMPVIGPETALQQPEEYIYIYIELYQAG